MSRKSLIAAIVACVFAVAVISGVIYHFRWIDIPDEPTPLAIDFEEENLAQMSAARVLNEIFIKFVDPADVPGKEKQLQNEIDKVKKIGFIEALGVYIVRADDLEKNPNAVLNRFKNSRFIEYIEPNYLLGYSKAPNDQFYKTLSELLTIINAQAGWDITTGNGVPAVAVVDSGVASHPDLPEPRAGYSVVSSLAYGNDKVNHGTGVASVVGAIGNNGIGAVGINWNANILPVKADDASGNLTVANVAKGIIWAADNGARVINLSIGTTTDSATLKTAIDYAYRKGVAIFAASGNYGKNAVEYPARYDNVMGIGSTVNGIWREPPSNYGIGLDVVAVGNYYVTSAEGGYMPAAGTSFASPQAAGLAALILSINPGLTNEDVYNLIRQGAKPLKGGYNQETGYGLIDIGNTLKLASAYGGSAAAPAPAKPVCATSPVITLSGFAELKLFTGDKYEEAGYFAVDCFEKNISSYINVSGSVNTAKPGIYPINYSVDDGYGNSARATRTVFVEDKPTAQTTPPTITVIGSNPIILHLGSKTLYTEQGAKAVDSDGRDISGSVEIIGRPDRNAEGVYTVTYSVVGKNGVAAAATRSVHIIAPNSGVKIRDRYSFNGQAKQGTTVPHSGIAFGASGWMDLKVTGIDKNMAIYVQLVNTANRTAAVTESFSAAGGKQYKVDEGKYELRVTVDKANGNSKYAIDLIAPETVTMEFDKKEVAF